ncbi:MAG: hypothetical protein ACR2PO_20760 [Methyloligellaceae bacterium]
MQWRWVIALVFLYLVWGLFGRSGESLDSSWQEASRNQSSPPVRHEPKARAPEPRVEPFQKRREVSLVTGTLVPAQPVKAVVKAPVQPRPVVAPKPWVEVTGSNVNLREAPRTSAKKLMSFSKPKRLLLMDKDKRWAFVQDPKSLTEGWIHLDYVRPVRRGESARAN